MSRVTSWAHCPGCGGRRERWPSEIALCVRCQVRLEVEPATGDYSARAELVARAAHRHTHWEEFRIERAAAVAELAAAITRAARQLYPGDRAELEWEWDDAAGRPTGRGRLRMRPASWPAAGPSPASVLGAALRKDSGDG